MARTPLAGALATTHPKLPRRVVGWAVVGRMTSPAFRPAFSATPPAVTRETLIPRAPPAATNGSASIPRARAAAESSGSTPVSGRLVAGRAGVAAGLISRVDAPVPALVVNG